MKIVLWIANQANQKALAHKIHAQFPLAGIILETKTKKQKLTLVKIADKIIENIFLSRIGKAWWYMINHYNKQYTSYPVVKLLDIENINSDKAYEFTQEINPDLIVVSGTRLVKEKMLSLKPTLGIINLHTGLSPYIKGGPNCTNWCIATNQFHLIGNTIMCIDAGIDSGNIITTQHTPFTGNETFNDVHLTVMEHAHSLYIHAIKQLLAGKNKSIKQDTIAKGTTYYSRQWDLKKKIALLKNFNRFGKTINSKETVALREKVITVTI